VAVQRRRGRRRRKEEEIDGVEVDGEEFRSRVLHFVFQV